MSLNIKNKIKSFPKTPGVYLMKNKNGEIIYIGKAGSLKARISSYFNRPHDVRIEKLVSEISDIDYQMTPTVIEALVLEANLIKKYLPKYNVREKDDKSFLYLGFSKEVFSRVILLRGHEAEEVKNEKLKVKSDKQKYKIGKLFGPYTSAGALRTALNILRKIFPFRDCLVFPKRPCLQYQLGHCGAPCADLISQKEYAKNINNLKLFFAGKKEKIIKKLNKEMAVASKKQDFETAGKIRNQIFALNHIRDVAMLRKEEEKIIDYGQAGEKNIFYRIEGYDISNISGTSATGSMVVFLNREPDKNEYRKFRIKTVVGPNDTAMLREVLSRRLKRITNYESRLRKATARQARIRKKNYGSYNWPMPDLILVDGGKGQINVAKEILKQYKLDIPLVGVAKGYDRKQDRFVYDEKNIKLVDFIANNKNLLLKVRDEAHRFAVGYHKVLRKKSLLKQGKVVL